MAIQQEELERDRQGDRKWIVQSVLLRTEEVMGLSEREENQECAARRRGASGRKEEVWVPEEEIRGERQVCSVPVRGQASTT